MDRKAMAEGQLPANPWQQSEPEGSRDATATVGDGRELAARSAAPLLSPGECLAGRFEIVRCLGQGGMGQVFEAFDYELDERVALKVIRPDRARRAGTLERFKREVQLARQVTHTNVCRIFDLSVHAHHGATAWGEEQRPVWFVTMELLPGETLAQRLRREGAFEPEQALPIVRQLAAALDAAHAAEVVHRDFKSANVILTETGDAPRAVVTDFGLAAVSGSDPEAGGTPSYAAPEQLAGEEVTAAADIYALGVVMREMLTGRPPTTAAPDADAPWGEDWLPRRWRAALQRCLARRPEKRFATAGDIVRALTPRRFRRWRTAGGIAAALGVALIGSGLREPAGTPESGPLGRPAVAVLGFAGAAGQRWMGTTLAELLSHQLEASDELRAFTGEEIQAFRYEIGTSASEAALLEHAGRLLGADYLVDGVYTVATDRIRLELRLSRANGGELARWEEEASQSGLADLAAAAGTRIRQHLGVRRPDPVSSGPRLSADPAALRRFADGLERLGRLDGAGAATQLQIAAASSPDSPWVWAALGRAHALAGADALAVEAASAAFERARGLPREPRLRLEAQLREAERDWHRASLLYRTLWTFYPGTLHYGLRLAAAQTAGGDPLGALETVAELRRRAAPEEDPRIDLAEAEAAQERGEHRRQLEAARRAIDGARAIGAEAMAAKARLVAAHALDLLGAREEARATAAAAGRFYADRGDLRAQAKAVVALAEQRSRSPLAHLGMTLTQALDAFRQVGDRAGEAEALLILTGPLLGEGKLELARLQIAESLRIAREVGSRRLEAKALNMKALAEFAADDLELALPAFEEALAAARASGNIRLVAGILGNLGRTQKLLAMQLETRANFEEAVAITRRTGSRFVHGLNSLSLGHFSVDQGDLTTAAKMRDEVATVAEQTGSESLRGHAVGLEATIRFYRGQTDRALAMARELVRESGERGIPKHVMTERELSLTSLLLASGRWREAEDRLHRIVASLPLESDSQPVAARLQLARALAAQGRAGEARRKVADVTPLLREIANEGLKLDLRAILAEIAEVEGRYGEAVSELDDLLADDRAHFVLRLGIRLQLAGALFSAEAVERARTTLEAVRLEAETTGYLHFVARSEAELTRLLADSGADGRTPGRS